MSVCSMCGNVTINEWDICSHHGAAYGKGWGRGNKAWCDFFHRGVIQPVPKHQSGEWSWEYLDNLQWAGEWA